MSTFLWLDSTAWTAITALATAFLVIVGGLTIISAAIDSRAKSRPYLVAEIRLGKHAERMDLFITNYGASAAKNVQVELPQKFKALGPWADSALGNTAKAMMRLKSKYETPLALVGPGQVEKNTWIFKDEILNSGNMAPEPVESITISYDKEGVLSRVLRLKYRDVFEVSYEARLYDTVSSSSLDLDQQMKVVITRLDGIGSAIHTVSDSVDRLYVERAEVDATIVA